MARLNEPPAAPASAGINSTSENIDACESTPTIYTAHVHPMLAQANVNTMRTKSKPLPTQPPATNLEEVKRRFIRQNRELARCNSNQSLRIRMLENDISRLLQDNLELREQILLLQNELYEARSEDGAIGVNKVKEELQAKLAELGALIGGLDVPRTSKTKQRPNVLKEKPWPFEAQVRERQSLAALMQDAQMPTIDEGRMYPRLTLDHDQIQQLRLSGGSTNSNESPEIGPPPIARFDCGDPAPIKFEAPEDEVPLASPAKKSDAVRETNAEDDIPSGLAINLETRRKRKDGQPRTERRRSSIMPASPSKRQEELPITLRTGAKRKLADRDTERPIKPPSKGDFTFSRRIIEERTKAIEAAPQVEGSEANKRPSTPTADGASGGSKVPIKLENTPETPPPVSPQKLPRKVLGEKDVNISPQKSKAREKASKDDIKKPIMTTTTTKPPTARERQKPRRTTISSIPLPSPKQEKPPETVDISLSVEDVPTAPQPPPETPATAVAFSSLPPPTSEPPPVTKLRSLRGETPPLQPSMQEDSNAGARRPSRRRSEVNYAEPSLVTKMRRSDKRLADAIKVE